MSNPECASELYDVRIGFGRRVWLEFSCSKLNFDFGFLCTPHFQVGSALGLTHLISASVTLLSRKWLCWIARCCTSRVIFLLGLGVSFLLT